MNKLKVYKFIVNRKKRKKMTLGAELGVSHDECPKHSSYTRVYSRFRFISSSNKCVYHCISDTRFFLYILSENDDIWKLCGDLKKEI